MFMLERCFHYRTMFGRFCSLLLLPWKPLTDLSDVARQLLQSYALFVDLISKQLGRGLEEVTPFIVMDIIHTVVRILSHEMKRTQTCNKGGTEVVRGGGADVVRGGGADVRGGGADVVRGGGMEVSLCFYILTTLARACYEFCPEVCVYV